MSPCLWICPACEMIGEEAEAERHMEGSGHAIKQLPQDASDGVRAVWKRERARVARLRGNVDLNVNPPEKEVQHGGT